MSTNKMNTNGPITSSLDKAIYESGLKLEAIARKMKINRVSLWNKIQGRTEFKASEIKSLSQILNLSAEQRDYIFFEK